MEGIQWRGRVFSVSAINRQGTEALCDALMERLEAIRQAEAEDPALVESERRQQHRMQIEARKRIEELRQKQRKAKKESEVWRDDDHDVEIIHVNE